MLKKTKCPLCKHQEIMFEHFKTHVCGKCQRRVRSITINEPLNIKFDEKIEEPIVEIEPQEEPVIETKVEEKVDQIEKVEKTHEPKKKKKR